MKKTHRYISRAAGILAAWCLTAGILITSVEAVCYWIPGYFPHEYEKHQVLEDVDMEMEDLLLVTDHMMGYLKGNCEELQITADIGGRTQPFFNQREISHMEDVKHLFLGGMALRRVCLCLTAVLLLVIWKLGGLCLLPRAICAGTGIVFGAAAVAAVLISSDFNKYFTLFHHIFFDNDLWILDPGTDRLINIVPQGFFIDTAFWCAAVFGVCMAVLLGVSIFVMLRQKSGLSGSRTGRSV